MGYRDQEKVKSNTRSVMLNHSRTFHYLKKVTQLVLSVTVFAFLFSQYQSSLLYYYNYHLSKFSLKLFTCTVERNFAFLMCNGILALIINASGLIRKITPVSSSLGVGGKADRSLEVQENTVNVAKADHHVLEDDKGEDDDRGKDENGENEENLQVCGGQIQDWEYLEDDDDDELSADELHQKCEDFIKKVKQEIHFTAADIK